MYSIIVNALAARETIIIQEDFDSAQDAFDYIKDNAGDFSGGDKAVIIDWENTEALSFFEFEEQIVAKAIV